MGTRATIRPAPTTTVVVRFPDRVPGLDFQVMSYARALNHLRRDGRVDIWTREQAETEWPSMDHESGYAKRFADVCHRAWGGLL